MRRRRAGLVSGSLLAAMAAAAPVHAEPAPVPGDVHVAAVRSTVGAHGESTPSTARVHAEPARFIDYIYVESNEGGSSGGHVALRLGDRVFHFQYADGGFLRVNRESFEGFRRHYTLLENRPIELTRIPVSGETFDLVLDFFTRRRIIRHEHFRVLESLKGDRALVETLRRVAQGERGPSITLEGAGYFFGDDVASPEDSSHSIEADRGTSRAILALRDRIAATHGHAFLGRRLEVIRRQLERLDPLDIEPPSLDVSADRAPAPVYGFAQRYRDAMQAEHALEVLRGGRGLSPGSYLSTGYPEVALRAGEREVVADLMEALAASLVRLVQSDRPDWGSALLVGLARLAALEKTSQSGSWVFLDIFATDAPRLTRGRLASEPELGLALLTEGHADFERARTRLRSRPASERGFQEIAFAELEASGNRLIETLRAAREGRDLRLVQGRQPPARRARVADLVVPAWAPEAFDERLRLAASREAEYGHRLRHLYGYHLFTRNCVTEIFQELDLAFAQAPGASVPSGPDADAAMAIREESRRRLGGYLEMTGLRFIPAVSAEAVAETYRGSETILLPSYRQARLARLYREEPPLRVFLRESNTLTSTLYRRNPEDSYFLFFTDDMLAVRPLFGMFNVATSLGATLAGVAVLPFDRGKTLWAGLKGIVFSLPELAFFNIRKGSFDHIPRHRRLE